MSKMKMNNRVVRIEIQEIILKKLRKFKINNLILMAKIFKETKNNSNNSVIKS